MVCRADLLLAPAAPGRLTIRSPSLSSKPSTSLRKKDRLSSLINESRSSSTSTQGASSLARWKTSLIPASSPPQSVMSVGTRIKATLRTVERLDVERGDPGILHNGFQGDSLSVARRLSSASGSMYGQLTHAEEDKSTFPRHLKLFVRLFGLEESAVVADDSSFEVFVENDIVP